MSDPHALAAQQPKNDRFVAWLAGREPAAPPSDPSSPGAAERVRAIASANRLLRTDPEAGRAAMEALGITLLTPAPKPGSTA